MPSTEQPPPDANGPETGQAPNRAANAAANKDKRQGWSQQHPGEPVIAFKDVTIRSSGHTVLDGISFSLQGGETRIILGPAGVGKSVLLKLANGLIEPESGSIRVFGQELTELGNDALLKMRDRVGMVFQEGALFDSLDVRDNVAYRLTEEHVPDEEIDKRVHEVLKFVELDNTFEKFPSELSGGMRRRVAIARAIVSQPELVLYDSPTGGLDPITSSTIIELVIKQRDVSHCSSLLVSHRLQDAFMLATHRFDEQKGEMVKLPDGQLDPSTTFLMLHEGKIIFDGSTEELVNSKDPFVQKYLG